MTESLLKTGEAFRRIDIGDETVQTNAIAYAEQVSVDPLIIDDAEPSMESGIMPLGSDDDFYWPITDDFKNLSISYNGKTHNGMHDHCTPTAATGIFRSSESIRLLREAGATFSDNCCVILSSATVYVKSIKTASRTLFPT